MFTDPVEEILLKMNTSFGQVQPEAVAVTYEELPAVDKYVLHRLSSVMAEIHESFEKYQFYRFFQVGSHTSDGTGRYICTG